MLIRAFHGEFGIKVRWHVPAVHALGPGNVVEVEEGEEALYPLAAEYRVLPRAHDDARRGVPHSCRRRTMRRFVPQPHVPQDVPAADVVICPRQRNYGATKNWSHWTALADMLRLRAVAVIAAGAPDSSARVDCPATWGHERYLDATIAAMHAAKLVVATDAGLAHLAVLCGRPLLIITHRGRVADGPVIGHRGRRSRPNYWYVNIGHYYHEANHMNAPIRMIDAWHDPAPVADWVSAHLHDPAAGPTLTMPADAHLDMAPRI